MDHLIIYVIKRMVLVHVNETLGGQNVTGTKGNLVLLLKKVARVQLSAKLAIYFEFEVCFCGRRRVTDIQLKIPNMTTKAKRTK